MGYDEDYDSWVTGPITKPEPKRWCPSHHRWEVNPPGRLLCGLAWHDQYELEREVAAEKLHPNLALLEVANNINQLVEEMRMMRYEGIAPPIPRPQVPNPPDVPPMPRRGRQTGRGGVALP